MRILWTAPRTVQDQLWAVQRMADRGETVLGRFVHNLRTSR